MVEKVLEGREIMQITQVSINKVVPKKDQPRKRIANIPLLARNIKKNGLINPISVERVENGLFEIISGERRFRACKFLKWKTVPCIVRKKSKFESLAENFCRDDLNVVEKAEAIDKMLVADFGLNYRRMLIRLKNNDATDWTDKEYELNESCNCIGYSPVYIYQISNILKIEKGIRSKMIGKNVSSSVALKLSTIKSKEIQAKIFKMISDGETDAIIIKAINAERFIEAKNISGSIDKMREVFFAYQNFGRGAAHIKSSVPILLNVIDSIGSTKKKTLSRNAEALYYLLSKLSDNNFQIQVKKSLTIIETLRAEFNEVEDKPSLEAKQ